ncbi:MAG: hypothetical protein ACOYX1_06605 [Acidobacteriota bacterium]
MAMRRTALLGLWMLAGAGAQTFPQEYRTNDAAVVSRIGSFFQSMSEEQHSLSEEFQRLIALPANRVYRQLDAQTRVTALQAALPLVKQIAMSEAVQKAHDEQMARQYGAFDHGLKLPYRPDPKKRFDELSRQIERNPAVMQKPAFLEEMMKAQQAVVEASMESAMDGQLTLFTKPLADVRQEFQNGRESAGRNAKARKCYDEAAPLADSDPGRFRLLAYRCSLLQFDVEKTEAEADRMRKERAQRLYDERGAKGVIRKTLTEFLETAAKVDFTAQTTAKGGREVFVNPQYENKSALWKLIYRNGKEPTEVAVQFARSWLAELQPPAPAPAPPAARPAGGAKAAPAKKAAPKK